MYRPRMRRRWLVAGGIAATLAAVLFALLSRTPERRPALAPSMAAPTPPSVRSPSDPRARLAGLRFLERNTDGTVAVIDDAIAKRSYFSKVGDLVLGAKVQTITAKEVTLADASVGVITLPYRGRGDSQIAIQHPFEARAEAVPVHIAPSVDPKKVAEDQAMIAEYQKTVIHGRGGGGRGGGGGGGGGGGRNRDLASGSGSAGAEVRGGRGRRRHLAQKAAKKAAEEAAAAAAKGSAAPKGNGSPSADDD
jgi:hypothetical protein